MTNICLYRASLNRIRQVSVCCYDNTFIVRNKQKYKFNYVVKMLSLYPRGLFPGNKPWNMNKGHSTNILCVKR